MSNQIPLEIITSILCRLPVKTLLRFRCISKPWCSQIDCLDFIKLHLKHSTETKSNHSIILSADKKLYSVNLDSLHKAIKMNFKHPYHHYTRVLGSCNGMLCISNCEEAISLLNPSTRQYHVVPFMAINYQRGFGKAEIAFWVYGFGYHPINDDYKVVKIVQFISSDFALNESDIMVYSLKTNGWRKLHNMPYVLHSFKNPGMFVGGALHWRMATIKDEVITQIIVAFDLGAEVFREVPPPPEFLHSRVHFEVGTLEGCLTVLATYVNVHADLWVMKQYGVKESWTKLLSVASPGLLAEVVKPLAYSKNGSQVLLQYNVESLLWYDLEKKSTEVIYIHGMPNTFDAFTCVGSLVPLKVHEGLCVKKQQAQEQKQNIRKKRDDFLSKGFKLVL